MYVAHGCVVTVEMVLNTTIVYGTPTLSYKREACPAIARPSTVFLHYFNEDYVSLLAEFNGS